MAADEAYGVARAYRNAMVSLGRESSQQAQPAELLEAYKGKIRTGIFDQARESAAQAWGFLLKWPPLGRKAGDLKRVLGEPTRTHGDQWEYRFDTGSSGAIFAFTIHDQRIIEVVI